jgi:hypothetical protein
MPRGLSVPFPSRADLAGRRRRKHQTRYSPTGKGRGTSELGPPVSIRSITVSPVASS